MSIDSRQLKKWPKIMVKKFQLAQESKEFRIIQADTDKLDCYYIMIQPTGGHYKGHTYILEVKTRHGDEYLFPFTPPLIKFVNQIWHPNISVTGSICLDILKDRKKWSPQYGIETVMSSIILLMDCPENSSPFNAQAAELFRTCETTYNDTTRGINITHDQRVQIFNECFEPFDSKASAFAGTNIQHYLEYFTNDLTESLGNLKV